MKPMLVYPAGSTEAAQHAAFLLHRYGIPLIRHPSPDITHLLLDVPAFSGDGTLRGGGDINPLLERLPESITIIGGNLNHKALEGYRKLDLLLDETYQAQNAAITAECALRTAAPHLKATFADTPSLVIGWGRIGKCLARLLKALGAEVTVAARKETDRAMLQALGYRAMGTDGKLNGFSLIFNTVPADVFTEEISRCSGCVKVDLASRKGLSGEDVIWARGLPELLAPESSGKLIAQRVIALSREEWL